MTRELRSLGIDASSEQEDSNTQEDSLLDQASQEENTSVQVQESQVPQEDLENQEFHEDSELSETMATPALATNINHFHSNLEITTEAGKKCWITATKGLDEILKCDGDKKDILMFLRNIERQGEKYGFATIGQNVPSGSDTINFFTNPGSVTLDEIQNHEDSYWNNRSDAANIQNSLKSKMLFHCSSNSALNDVILNIQDKEASWKRSGGGLGLVFLHHVFRSHSHGTSASAFVCNKQLNTVQTKDFSHNIVEVNKYFSLKNNEILSAGEGNDDHIFQLFNCYASCPVQKFQNAIQCVKNKSDEKKNVTAEILMAKASSCYNALQLEHRWITEDPKIVAMTTCLEKIQETANAIALMSASDSFQQSDKKQRSDRAWMFEIPPEDEPQEKLVDGKTFYVCRKDHNNEKVTWVRHKPEDHNSSKFQSRKGKTRKGDDIENNRN